MQVRILFATVFRPEGLLWIALGAGLTLIPTLIIGFIAFKLMKIDFGTVSGMLCGSMANPMALNLCQRHYTRR